MSQHGCPERLSSRSKGFQEEGSQPTMEVLVETLTGTAFEMTVSPSDTIFAIKSKICRVEGIPVSQQHLVYRLRELEDAWSLGALGISDGARLRLVLGMRGGPVSTRRLPPPQPWHDIERLLHSNSREDEDWSSSGSGSCRVTVVVFRDGERVNMLRVRENKDGTYSPIDHTKCEYSTSLTHLEEQDSERPDSAGSSTGSSGQASGEASGQAGHNAVTAGKMMDLRRRMESLSLRRSHHGGDKSEMQKTRSEETLSVARLLDEAGSEPFVTAPYSEAEDGFSAYGYGRSRYEYDCSFAERYTLLPPIGRTDSDLSMQDAIIDSVQGDGEVVQLSDGVSGSILVPGTPCEGPDDTDLSHDSLTHLPTNDYGGLVGGSGSCWRVVGFGSSSQLATASPSQSVHLAPHSQSASSLQGAPHSQSASSLQGAPPTRPTLPPPDTPRPPLAHTAFSSSTSDLEKLKRNRILPALSRHRNREHLHLSDDALDLPRLDSRRITDIAETDRFYRFAERREKEMEIPKSQEKKEDAVKEKKARIRCGWCRKKLSIATVHVCRCGAVYCAAHRYAEVHGCRYDYKRDVAPALPAHAAPPKLPKI